MKQCKTCPWRIDADPHAEITNGYSEELHKKLECTIAKPSVIGDLFADTKIMACHYSEVGKETPCVGYLANQLGPGNNIQLRFWAMHNLKGEKLELIGEQHERFQDTLP